MFVTVSGTAPWILRIDDIKAATAVNVEAERKVAQLSDEIQALARTIRIKDQQIQETGVKIELMERRMETVKKQADTITDLENELAKARKQERAYEEAMEQLQADLDALEQDNAKLKALANNPEPCLLSYHPSCCRALLALLAFLSRSRASLLRAESRRCLTDGSVISHVENCALSAHSYNIAFLF